MIRAATEADLPKIAQIYEEILDLEEQTGVTTTNWQRGKYPTQDSAREAFAAGTLYVMEEEGDLFGCVNLNGVQLPEYDAIPWSFAADRDQVMVIHTLCISPRWAGRGKAREFVDFCEAEARRQGKHVMRLDTWIKNTPANHLYPKLGYRLAGKTMFHFMGFVWEELNCYERVL